MKIFYASKQPENPPPTHTHTLVFISAPNQLALKVHMLPGFIWNKNIYKAENKHSCTVAHPRYVANLFPTHNPPAHIH